MKVLKMVREGGNTRMRQQGPQATRQLSEPDKNATVAPSPLPPGPPLCQREDHYCSKQNSRLYAAQTGVLAAVESLLAGDLTPRTVTPSQRGAELGQVSLLCSPDR